MENNARYRNWRMKVIVQIIARPKNTSVIAGAITLDFLANANQFVHHLGIQTKRRNQIDLVMGKWAKNYVL